MKEEIKFEKIGKYPKGTLYSQLKDTYSFNKNYEKYWNQMWKDYDNFFYDNPNISNKYGFVTVVNGEAVGHITWDPRHRPQYVEIGHNCIITKYKGKKYGKIQLQEALRRIKEYDVEKIIVTTDEITIAAQKNYESVGFVKVNTRDNEKTLFTGKYFDYELRLKTNKNNIKDNSDNISQ